MTNSTTTGLGFLAGVGCGVGIAMLAAPRTGRETRAMLADKAREEAGQLKAQAAELCDTANGALQKQEKNIKQAVKAGVQAFHESVS